MIDARGSIEAFNPAAEQLFGYREAELLGQNVKILMPSPHHEQHDGYIRNYLTTGVPRIIGKGREVHGRRRDGTTFPLHLSVGEVVLAGERKLTGILHDLSECVRMEEQLRERAALARLGEMAAVSAHEVKNPLAGIRGAIQMFARKLPPNSADTEMAQQIIERIDALNELMQDLLLFARPPEPRRSRVDVGAIVTSTADLLNRDPTLQDVRVQIQGESPPIAADPELLKIVFLNVMVNGGHAMSGRGVIRVDLASDDATCRVAFKDNGPGIPRHIRDKIFRSSPRKPGGRGSVWRLLNDSSRRTTAQSGLNAPSTAARRSRFNCRVNRAGRLVGLVGWWTG